MMRRIIDLAAVAVVAAFLCAPARGQDMRHPTGEAHWYDFACCSDRDCRPATPGEVVFDGTGWLVTSLGVTVALGDARIRASKAPDDSRWHLCVSPARRLLCAYQPLERY